MVINMKRIINFFERHDDAITGIGVIVLLIIAMGIVGNTDSDDAEMVSRGAQPEPFVLRGE